MSSIPGALHFSLILHCSPSQDAAAQISAHLNPNERQNHPINLSTGAARTACPSLWSLKSHWPFLMQHIPTQASPRCQRHFLGQRVCWGQNWAQLLYTFTLLLHLQLLPRHLDQLRDSRWYSEDSKHQQRNIRTNSIAHQSYVPVPVPNASCPNCPLFYLFKKKIAGISQQRLFISVWAK